MVVQGKRVIIHCANTPNGLAKYTARDIDTWHAAKGMQRYEAALRDKAPWFPYIGYHRVILVSGSVIHARGLSEPGEHCGGRNSDSWGICLMGKDKFTEEQWDSLAIVVGKMQGRTPWPRLLVRGHYQYNKNKTCPGFDVPRWFLGGMKPLDRHVCKAR